MWQDVLRIVGLIGLDLGLVVCLLLVPLGVPGNFIMIGLALLAAWIGGFQSIGWLALVLMLAAAVLGEVVEALLGSAMARRFGASWWGVGGAFVGGIVGAMLGSAVIPLLGTLVRAFLGAAAGAVALEAWHARKVDQGALRAGWGAFLGKLLASLFKMSIGMGIAAWIVLRTH